MKAVFGILAQNGVNVVKIERLTVTSLGALQVTVNLPQGLTAADLSQQLWRASQEHGLDVSFQPDDVERWMRRLIVFDMDSTLIQQEVIDELARIAGVEAEVKAITEAAMRGEIDFFGSLQKRVALLEGANAEGLFDEVKKSIQFNPGAERLCSV